MKNSKEKITNDIERAIQKLNQKIDLLNSISKKYSYTRLLVFIAATLLFVGFYVYNYKSSAVVIVSILSIIFLVLMNNHSKIEKAIKKFKIFLQIKKEELARIKLDWENIPIIEHNFIDDPNFLEQDLNVTEKNGLLQLINIGASVSSINILREWLSGNVNEIKTIVDRQKIIKELKDLKRFRDRLLLTTKLSIKNKFEKVGISDWIKTSQKKKGLMVYTIFLVSLCLTNIFVLVGYFAGILDSYYYQFLMFYIFFYFAGIKYVNDIQRISDMLYDEIRKFSSIFRFIENYNYQSNKSLITLLKPFLDQKKSPSKLLNKINFIVELLNFRKNPFVWFFFILLAPLDYMISIKIEKFRKTIKTDFPIWLNTWCKLEAYSSLASFAYLNPDYHFPEVTESPNLFEANNLGHPLINPGQKINNDFSINEDARTNIITGSNMSGKSTFLRTVGVNILLSYAGSVVNAEKLTISKFKIYSCIKVSDSVVDGISYFYAEVKRLKHIISEIKNDDSDSLVLIDEIYKGTNNVERIVGSRALIKYLSTESIYSIISTHDLELVKIEDEIKNTKNYHFRELIQENKMSFDFKLMGGPCPTTNALKIMKLEGLPT